ncbi:MAG: arginine repressor [Eubacteriales bacterium]|nr:arginine repressor [Eubacteriales bacterium]
MKNRRQMKILEIIAKEEIGTQEELARRLCESGEDVTQATVSRDIKELRLIKVAGSEGRAKYAPSTDGGHVSNRLMRIFIETVVSIDSSGNLVLIRTLSGSANAAGEAVDAMGFSEILGSLAGDNTLLLVVREGENAAELAQRLRAIIK